MKRWMVFMAVALFCFSLSGQHAQKARDPGPAREPVPDLERTTAAGTWQAIGPEGGDVKAAAVNPQNASEIFIVVSGSLFKTTNAGQFWQRVNVPGQSLNDIAFDPANPNILYALYYSGVYKSTDHGANWTSYAFPSYCYGTGKLSVDANNPSIVYACGEHAWDSTNWKTCLAVFKSTNGGANWGLTKIEGSSTYGGGYCIAVAPNNSNIVYMSGYYSMGSTYYYKLFKSTDAGANWADSTGVIGTTYSISTIAVDPTNASKVYAGTAWGIYRSSDGGANWQKNNGNAFATALAVEKTNPAVVYAGYENRFFKSTNGGADWAESSGSIYGQCRSLAGFSNTIIFGTSSGAFRSLNGGITWDASHAGIYASSVLSLAIAPNARNIIYAGVLGDGFFKSTNFGGSWQKVPNFFACTNLTTAKVLTTFDAQEVYALAAG